jgi:hypothetical protein
MKNGEHAKFEKHYSLLKTNFSVELMEERFHGMTTLLSLPASNGFISASPN